jgi:enoyl-CoA hydratase/carnithine racemase
MSGMPELTRDGDVFFLNIGDGENRFHPAWIAGFNQALDRIEAAPGPKALVTTATGKYWSTGLDLDWIGENSSELPSYLAAAHHLLARVLALPVPAVAAIQGHCFAAGAMIALAHDVRVMRADRGYFCLPEIDIQLSFTPGMSALIQARLPAATAHTAMTTGRRYGGYEALEAGLVDQLADEGKVIDTAIAAAQPLAGKHSATLGAIKSVMYAEVLRGLRDDRRNTGAAADALTESQAAQTQP